MKKWMMMAVATAAVLVFSNTAFADNEKKVRFYNFEFQTIEGEVRGPDVAYETARQRIEHERLLDLKKSFLPVLLKSSKDKAL